MRTVFLPIILSAGLTCIADSAPVSEADLKNLLVGIRQNRITQADFQEQRIMRLMKKPVVSSGRISYQAPNKFRREVKGGSARPVGVGAGSQRSIPADKQSLLPTASGRERNKTAALCAG
jgi:hypothetical protein